MRSFAVAGVVAALVLTQYRPQPLTCENEGSGAVSIAARVGYVSDGPTNRRGSP